MYSGKLLITDEQRSDMVMMRKDGKTYRHIAEKYGILPGSVMHHIKQHKAGIPLGSTRQGKDRLQELEKYIDNLESRIEAIEGFLTL